MGDLLEISMPDPSSHNLNVGGVIMVDVDEKVIYGFKITKHDVGTSVCFDVLF